MRKSYTYSFEYNENSFFSTFCKAGDKFCQLIWSVNKIRKRKVAMVHACMTEKHDVVITLRFYILLFQNFCANRKIEVALFINSKILSTRISSSFTTCETIFCRVKKMIHDLANFNLRNTSKIVFEK